MITTARMIKIFGSFNGPYSLKQPIDVHPFELEKYSECLELSKDGYVSILLGDTKRPIITRVDGVYKVYTLIKDKWHLIGTSEMDNTLGRHIRYMVRYENRRCSDFYQLRNFLRKTDLKDKEAVRKTTIAVTKTIEILDEACNQDGNSAKVEFIGIRTQFLAMLEILKSA